MAEDQAERLKRLMGASGVSQAKSLPGSNQTRGVGADGTSKPRLSAETFQQPQQSNVRTLYLTDGTGSMWEELGIAVATATNNSEYWQFVGDVVMQGPYANRPKSIQWAEQCYQKARISSSL